jgi:hypothetical protein
MPDRLLFSDDDEPNPEGEPRYAADPDEDGDDWDDRPRAAIAKVLDPPPSHRVVPADHDEALELEAELQLSADMQAERRMIKAGRPSQRARAAVRMDGFGFSLADIARMLLFPTPKDAFETITGTIAALVPEMDLATARKRHSSRLEMLLSAVIPRAIDPKNDEQLAYSKRANELLDSLARLHGTNAPSQVQVSTPEADEFNRVLNTVFAHRNPDLPKEIDVFDLEENEDGVFAEPERDADGQADAD